MDVSRLTKKQKEEIRKIKEEERRLHFEKYKENLSEYYFEHYSDDIYEIYNLLMDLLREKYICTEQKYNYQAFVNFVDKYSSHRDEYIEEHIQKYLDEESSEEEDDEQDYEFLQKDKGY